MHIVYRLANQLGILKIEVKSLEEADFRVDQVASHLGGSTACYYGGKQIIFPVLAWGGK